MECQIGRGCMPMPISQVGVPLLGESESVHLPVFTDFDLYQCYGSRY